MSDEKKSAQPVAAAAEVLDLPGAIMNIPCRRADDTFLNLASRLLYKEGHRDARHDAADLVLARADELAALAAPVSATEQATVEQILRRENNRLREQLNQQRPAFLLNGTRFKLNFSSRGNVDVFHNYAAELQGRWVALVPAEDDMHLSTVATPADAGAGLTDERIDHIKESLADDHPQLFMPRYESMRSFARAIEREVLARLPTPAAPVTKLEDIEQYRLQMAAIGTAALGYWKESDGIKPEYDTVPLRDVARLYAKYEALAGQSPAPVTASEEVLALHRQLAAEKLRADQGWQRADAKSKECAELRERLASTQPAAAHAAQWISVGERLPECLHECTTSHTDVSNTVLVYGPTEFGTPGIGFGHYRNDGTWACYEGEYDQMTVANVTHWMPTPKRPTQPAAINEQGMERAADAKGDA